MAAIFETWVTGRMARHRAEEAERNAPVVVALDALMVVRGAMERMTIMERHAIIDELAELSDAVFSSLVTVEG